MKHLGDLIDFRSSGFPRNAEDDELVNADSMHGHALAQYIGKHLAASGFEVSSYIAEDWGWCCEVANPEFALWYGVCSMEDDSYLIQFHPDRPVIRRWFKKVDVAERTVALQDAVFSILANCESRLAEPLWVGD